MRLIQTLLPVLLTLGASSLHAAEPDDVFLLEEAFTSEAGLADWTAYSTADGRIRVVPSPIIDGESVLLMDDGVNDGIFSKNVLKRTVAMQELQNLKLEFQLERQNEEIHNAEVIEDDTPFDGMVLRLDGRVEIVFQLQHLNDGSVSIPLSNIIPESRLRAASTLTLELHQYDNFSSPDDGLIWDNIRLFGKPRMEILPEAPGEIMEGEAFFTIPVVMDPVPSTDVTLMLYLNSTVVASAVYPAGESLAMLQYPGYDDEVLGGDFHRTFYLSDGYYRSRSFTILIRDNEHAGLVLSTPATIREENPADIPLDPPPPAPYVQITTPTDSWLTVELESSRPDVLTVPSSISVRHYGEQRENFSLQTVYDPRIRGDIEVTITARYGSEEVSSIVLVEESNSLDPFLSGPDVLTEGDSDITYLVTINAEVDTDMEINLASSDPSIVIQPSTVTVPSGSQSAPFTLSAPDNSTAEANIPVTLTASVAGGGETTLSLELIDNEVARFVADLPDFIQKGTSLPLTVSAANQSGDLISNYAGSAAVLLYDSESQTETEVIASIDWVEGVGTLSLEIPVDSSADFLVVRASDGTESRFGPFEFITIVDFPANSLVYDETRDRLYALSGADALAGHLQSLTAIDPYTGAVEDTLFLGNEPSVADITDDGQFLYVGLNGSFAVRRVALETFSLDTLTILDAFSVWQDDSFRPVQILTIPGRPLDFIASQDHTQSTYSAVYAYFDGVTQPSGNSHDAWKMVRGGTDGEFYGFNYTDTGFDFTKSRISSDGFEIVESVRQLISGWNLDLVGVNDKIFSTLGDVVDGLQMERIAKINFPWAVDYNSPRAYAVADAEKSRVYYASGNEIAVYDVTSLLLLEHVQLPVAGNITAIERFGESGLAVLTEQGELVLVESGRLLPSGEPVDLEVTVEASPKPVYIDGTLTFTYTVENVGTVPARNVQLALLYSDGMELVDSEFPFTEPEAGKLLHLVGDLEPGQQVEVVSRFQPTRLTTLVGRASVSSQNIDMDYENNLSSDVLNVGFLSLPGSLNTLEIASNYVLVEPVSGKLVLATREDAIEGIANSVLVMDPLNGLVEKAIQLPEESVRLAVSDDGSVLYALGRGRNSLHRIDLEAGMVTASIGLTGLDVDDFEVLPGTTDSIILGSGWDGVRIYDNGVLRPSTSGTYNGDQVELLPDPNLAFGYNTEHSGFESYKFQITPEGVVTLEESGGLFSGFTNELEAEGYYIHSPNGRVVRADDMVVDGNFDFSGAFSGYASPATVEPDRARQRVYFAGAKTIASFDSESYLLVRSVNYDQLTSNFRLLERWGSDGFCALLENGHVVILRSDLVPAVLGGVDLIIHQGDHLLTDLAALTLSGEAYAGQGISQVTINGEVADSEDGFINWNYQASLQSGANTYTITATPAGAGDPVSLTRTLYHDPEMALDGLYAEGWARDYLGWEEMPADWKSSNADADASRLFAEYLFGMDPLVQDLSMLELSARLYMDGELLAYRRLAAFRDHYRIAVSSDMINWDESESTIEFVGIPYPAAEDSRYEDILFRMPEPPQEGVYLRVLVD